MHDRQCRTRAWQPPAADLWHRCPYSCAGLFNHKPSGRFLACFDVLVLFCFPISNFFCVFFKVARLQSEFCTKDFFRATNFLTKNAPKLSPNFLSLCSVGQKKHPRKIPSKFPTKFSKFPCEKTKKKFTDELLQERRENVFSLLFPRVFRGASKRKNPAFSGFPSLVLQQKKGLEVWRTSRLAKFGQGWQNVKPSFHPTFTSVFSAKVPDIHQSSGEGPRRSPEFQCLVLGSRLPGTRPEFLDFPEKIDKGRSK